MNRLAETRPAEPGFGVFELVILAAVAAGSLAVCLPALVVAVPLGMAIEGGGWRRWPAVVAGAVLTGLVVLAGGWDATATPLSRSGSTSEVTTPSGRSSSSPWSPSAWPAGSSPPRCSRRSSITATSTKPPAITAS